MIMNQPPPPYLTGPVNSSNAKQFRFFPILNQFLIQLLKHQKGIMICLGVKCFMK